MRRTKKERCACCWKIRDVFLMRGGQGKFVRFCARCARMAEVSKEPLEFFIDGRFYLDE